MIKTLILVPEYDNEGQPFDRADWRFLEESILEAFGGFTDRTGVSGAWRSGDRIYRDQHREFTITLDSWARLPAWLGLVESVRLRFRQEAIYTEVAGIPEIMSGQLS